jgi:hypothetical protein
MNRQSVALRRVRPFAKITNIVPARRAENALANSWSGPSIDSLRVATRHSSVHDVCSVKEVGVRKVYLQL